MEFRFSLILSKTISLEVELSSVKVERIKDESCLVGYLVCSLNKILFFLNYFKFNIIFFFFVHCCFCRMNMVIVSLEMENLLYIPMGQDSYLRIWLYCAQIIYKKESVSVIKLLRFYSYCTRLSCFSFQIC